MFFDTEQTASDLSFRLAGIPIRIHPFFWLVAVLFSPFLRSIDDMRTWLVGLAGWIAAWLLSFIIHEMGHALVVKKIFGADPKIVLYGFGGATVYQPFYRRVPNAGGRILISFAGPAAELLAVGALLLILALGGCHFIFTLDSFGPLPIPFLYPVEIVQFIMTPERPIQYGFGWFAYGMIWMGIFWSILNLLPIYPLDGGQMTRHFCQKISPAGGLAFSLKLSIVCALTMLAFCLREQNFFIAMFFGMFAYANFQELSCRRF